MFTPDNLYWVLGEQELGPIEFYFSKALVKNGRKTNYINIHGLYSPVRRKLSAYSHRFPRKYDNKIQQRYFNLINKALIEKYKAEKPAFIFVYNDCKLLPETIQFFKKFGSKVIVFLGDDPNYLFPAKKTFLLTVMNADAVILPDTGWIDGLKILDVKKIIYSPMGTDTDIFFPLTPNEEQLRKYKSDILFIGTGYYLNSWGLRRAAILNELEKTDFKIFGDSQWDDLFTYFPGLKKKFINEKLNATEVNIACNCAKIYPVVVNSGVINGASTRVFDCMASGIFIIAEYRKDLQSLFTDDEIVFFKTKTELKEKAEYFLKNENEMKGYIKRASEKVREKYTLNISVKNILEQL